MSPRHSATTTFFPRWETTRGRMVEVNLTASTNLQSLDEFRNLIVKQQNGGYVRLSDVANVTLGSEDL